MKYYDDIGYRKGNGGNLACSEKAAALLSQCAWCNRMTQDGIAYGPVVEKDLTASYGICEDCFNSYFDVHEEMTDEESDNA